MNFGYEVKQPTFFYHTYFRVFKIFSCFSSYIILRILFFHLNNSILLYNGVAAGNLNI